MSDKPSKKLFEITELLDTEKHKNLKWRCLGASCPKSCCYAPVRSSVGFSEISHLSLYFPIIFPLIKYSEDQPASFEMNLFYKLDIDVDGSCVYLKEGFGCILGEDKPTSCKQYPFSPVKDQTGRTLVNIDLTCPGWSDVEGEPVLLSKEEMNPLFMVHFVQPGINFLQDYEQTRLFVQALVEYDLIRPGTFTYKGISVSFNAVDEKALMELPQTVLRDFEQKGYIRAIYYHLHSLYNYKRLIDAYLQRNPERVSLDQPIAFAP